jgi:hypothetical protein
VICIIDFASINNAVQMACSSSMDDSYPSASSDCMVRVISCVIAIEMNGTNG